MGDDFAQPKPPFELETVASVAPFEVSSALLEVWPDARHRFGQLQFLVPIARFVVTSNSFAVHAAAYPSLAAQSYQLQHSLIE